MAPRIHVRNSQLRKFLIDLTKQDKKKILDCVFRFQLDILLRQENQATRTKRVYWCLLSKENDRANNTPWLMYSYTLHKPRLVATWKH